MYNSKEFKVCKAETTRQSQSREVSLSKKHLKRLRHKAKRIPINVSYVKTVMQQQKDLHGLESVILSTDAVVKAEPDNEKENKSMTCRFNLPFQPVNVIIHTEKGGGMMTQGQQEFVKNEIWKAMNAGRDSPRFERMTIENGIFKITCSDAVSLLWLSKTVWVMPTYENRRFLLTLGDGLDTLVKAIVWIPEQHRKPREILKMLRAQNRGLDTSRWKIISTHNSGNGINMEIAIDQNSLDFLKSEYGFRPYFFLTRVTIYVYGK